MHSYWAAAAVAAQRREALIGQADTARLVRRAGPGRHRDPTRRPRWTPRWVQGLRRRPAARPAEARG